jgi:hypothetical protein
MTEPASNETSTRDLRVSDAEREHVVNLLQRAVGRGLIDLDEFTARSDTALAAGTRGELNAVLIDLPGMVHPSQRYARPANPGARPHMTGNGQPLHASFSSVKRKGRWVVPPELSVHTSFGSAELDFTEAEINSAVVYIDLQVNWGSAELRVPEFATVDTSQVSVSMGSVEDRVGLGPEQGVPHFVIAGRVRGGSLEIKYPKGFRRFRGRSHGWRC